MTFYIVEAFTLGAVFGFLLSTLLRVIIWHLTGEKDEDRDR